MKIQIISPVPARIIDEATIVSDGSGNYSGNTTKNVSQTTLWGNYGSIFTQFKIKKIRVTLLPIGGDIAGILGIQSEHIQDETPASAPTVFNTFVEDNEGPSKHVIPANRKVSFLVPIRDQNEWYDMSNESTNQKSEIVNYLVGEYLPVSTAIYKLLVQWDIVFR